MKHKILLAVAVCFVSLVIPHYASAYDPEFRALYYGYGEPITLTSNTPTELLSMELMRNEIKLHCHIEASGYVKTEDSSAVLKVWLEVEGDREFDWSEFATDEEITRRYIGSKSGPLQSSFYTTIHKRFHPLRTYRIRLLGSNFAGSGSLYVNYHAITVTCTELYPSDTQEYVIILNPNEPPPPPPPTDEIVISGHVYKIGGRTPYRGINITGFPNGGVATTDSYGFYSKKVPKGWSGVLKPCHPSGGPCFTPITGKTYTNVTSDQTNQDYKEVFSLVPCAKCP